MQNKQTNKPKEVSTGGHPKKEKCNSKRARKFGEILFAQKNCKRLMVSLSLPKTQKNKKFRQKQTRTHTCTQKKGRKEGRKDRRRQTDICCDVYHRPTTHLEILELREVGEERVAEIVVGDVEILKSREGENLGRKLASEVVAIQGDVEEVGKVTQVSRHRA
jgi:hypothetical protein